MLRNEDEIADYYCIRRLPLEGIKLKEDSLMSKKTILAVVVALFLGIGGTVAYFYIHSLYVANTAPIVPPATTQQPAGTVPPAGNTTIPAATQTQVAAAGGVQIQPSAAATLTDDQLVLGQISYGASIDAVRQRHGEPNEIDRDDGMMKYEYKNVFDLYVANGIVQRIKVDDLNALGTPKGIKVGSSVDDVVAAYGQPNAVVGDHIIYHSANNPSVGLNFEIESNHVEKIVCGMLQ